MKQTLLILALAGLILAACSGQKEAVFASFAPSGRPYETIDIQTSTREAAADTGSLPVTVTFTSRTGEVMTIAMERQGGSLIFAQTIPASGVLMNDAVSDELLRAVLIDAGITNAGQFKPVTAKTTLDLILAFSDPERTEVIVPPQFELLDTNLEAKK